MLSSFWRYPDATRAARYTVIEHRPRIMWSNESCVILKLKELSLVVLDEDAYAFKAVKFVGKDHYRNRAVLALMLPAGTGVHLSSDKCRATEAYVLAATESHKRYLLADSGQINNEVRKGFLADGTREYFAFHNAKFKYNVGDFVTPIDDFEQEFEICGSGIHCFRTYRKAFNY